MKKNLKRAMGLGQILAIILVALIGAFTLASVNRWINNAKVSSNKAEGAFKNLFDNVEENKAE